MESKINCHGNRDIQDCHYKSKLQLKRNYNKEKIVKEGERERERQVHTNVREKIEIEVDRPVFSRELLLVRASAWTRGVLSAKAARHKRRKTYQTCIHCRYIGCPRKKQVPHHRYQSGTTVLSCWRRAADPALYRTVLPLLLLFLRRAQRLSK